MLFLKEMKKCCFHAVYLLFVCLLLFEWHGNFYGVTEKEIAAAKNSEDSRQAGQINGFALQKPQEGAAYYGSKSEDAPDKIMAGAADHLLIEYRANSYATYPFGYYKEIRLDQTGQKGILAILTELTGLTENELQNLPGDYFPAANGVIFHTGAGVMEPDGSYVLEPNAKEEVAEPSDDYRQHFIPQVSYERFWELMGKAEDTIGTGSYYSKEMLEAYFGLGEMSYEEAVEEYKKTIYDDKITGAFARLFCDYMTRPVSLYAVCIAAAVCLMDQRHRMRELAGSKRIRTVKWVGTRFAAMLALVLLPVALLSLESWIPLMAYAKESGLAADQGAFLKYILWWLLPSAMEALALGMLLTEWTGTPAAIAVQGVWWFLDTGMTRLSGDVKPFTLMIRHNTLNGSELVHKNFAMLCINRGILVTGALLLLALTCAVYEKRETEYGGVRMRCEMAWDCYNGFGVAAAGATEEGLGGAAISLLRYHNPAS